MVDINLIGDDNMGEEKSSEQKRVDEFTQTSSMDTQELAFEERTETFDTTKTAGLAHKRNYSSFISTIIIFAVIVVLGWAIYYFMFRGDDTNNQAELPQFIPDSETIDESLPEESETQQTQTSNFESNQAQVLDTENKPEQVQKPETREIIPSSTNVSGDLNPVTAQFLSTSKMAIQTVTSIMTSMPSNINTTLLSCAGQRVRFEFVSSSSAETDDFTARLNQFMGNGDFSVVSKSEVATNGQFMEKVLLTGTIAQSGSVLQGDYIEFLNVQQLKDWLQKSTNQFGLQMRPPKIQQGKTVDDYLRVPVLLRISGNKAALLDFLAELEAQNLNIELTKILVVSPDMISFSDEKLILIMNIFLYQRS